MADEKETKKKAPAKTAGKATAKKAVVGKKAAPKAQSAGAQSAAVSVIAKKATGKKIKVTQIGSPIGRQDYQKGTLIGLGLNKMNKSRVLVDTPSVRGMIESIPHLIKVEDAA